MRFSARIALLTLAVVAPGASSALADSVQSSNWAGYAVHRAGVRFTKVVAAWRQPSASCTRGSEGFSAVWVGLGGYSEASSALEQVGSEVDCTASGRVASSVWYELVPAPSTPIRMRVRPGDALVASVSVSGHKVVIVLDDATRHRSFKKTLHASSVDLSSAEWIVEAPSECVSVNRCQTLPLANFGTAMFSLAAAESSAGHAGTISDPSWDSTRIQLTPDASRFVLGPNGTVGVATPSALNPQGNSFDVTFSTVAPRSNSVARARQASLSGGYLVHPRRW